MGVNEINNSHQIKVRTQATVHKDTGFKKIFDKKIDTTILKQKVLERIRLYVKAKNENSELD